MPTAPTAKRIVTLAPSLTELAFAAGAEATEPTKGSCSATAASGAEALRSAHEKTGTSSGSASQPKFAKASASSACVAHA